MKSVPRFGLPALAGVLLSLTALADPPRVAVDFGRVPLAFEPNVGQFGPGLQFGARGPGYGVALGRNGVDLYLGKDARLGLRFADANPRPAVTGERIGDAASNYFIGRDASKYHLHVPHYGAVRYRAVYPGIDWLVYGNGRQLEYDLVVAPGADPGLIRLKLDGADRLALDEDGDLLVTVGKAVLRQHLPVIYQLSDRGEKEPVEGHYMLDGKHRRVAFAVGDYDRGRELVIDPVFSYSTYLGGKDYDYGKAVAVDSSGDVYVTGNTPGNAFPFSGGFGGICSFITKLNPTGSQIVYSDYLGASACRNTSVGGIAVDSAGSVYVAGSTDSSGIPVTAGAFQTAYAGGGDGFITKINPAGNALVYSTYLGGSTADGAGPIAVDSGGNVYVAGVTNSKNFPTKNPFQGSKVKDSSFDAFVTKINPTGTALVYSTYLSGSAFENQGNAIAVDSEGCAYVTGYTTSDDFPLVNPLQSKPANIFVTKFDPTGSSLIYSTYLGGTAFDEPGGIAVDGAGNAILTGFTRSTDFPTKNPIQAQLSGSQNAFVSKIAPAGNALVYSTYLGGGGDGGNGIAVDSAANAYVAGTTSSANFPVVNALQPTNLAEGQGNSLVGFVTKLNPGGTALVYSTYLGGNSGYDYTDGIAADGKGGAYIIGTTYSTDFPTANAYQPANAGGEDAFITKISDAADPQLSVTPAVWTYPARTVDTTSSAKLFTLKNIGKVPLMVQSVAVSGAFAITSDNCVKTIAAGKTCSIFANFTPAKTGDNTGALTITSNALTNPDHVQLSGTGK